MYLRYGFIADHITPGQANKKIVIGIFDLIAAPPFQSFTRVCRFSCGWRARDSKPVHITWLLN